MQRVLQHVCVSVCMCVQRGRGKNCTIQSRGKKKEERNPPPDHFPVGQIRSSFFFGTFGRTLMYLLVYKFGCVYYSPLKNKVAISCAGRKSLRT